MIEELLLCQCGDPSHQLIVYYDDNDEAPCVYVSVHLTPERNFFKRLWRGIKYVFSNERSIYGDFDEIIIRTEDLSKVERIVDTLKSVKKVEDFQIPLILQETKFKS